MGNLGLIILVFAFVFSCIAAFWGPAVWPRAHFGWMAIACWIFSELVGGAAKLLH